MPFRRRLRVLLLPVPALALAGATLAGCSGTVDAATLDTSIKGVEVTGTPGEPPRVRIAAPLDVGASTSATVVAGSGDPLYLDRIFVLELSIYDARTGKKALSTYDEGQTALAVTDPAGTLFPVLAEALTGQRQGSRVVVAASARDAYGDSGAPQYGIDPGDPVVLVADVVAVPPGRVLAGPEGRHRPAPAAVPRLVEREGQPRAFAFGASGPHPPGRLVVATLVEGDGPKVGAHDLVTLDYLGQRWGARTPFEDTFPKEPVTVPLGVHQVVPAWDRALVGVRRGSRVLVVAPPDLAFGETGNPPQIPANATLVYVIDVLGVS